MKQNVNEISVWAKKEGKIRKKDVRELTLKFLEILRIRASALAIFLLSDREIVKLKRQFLPLERGPANVLAFPADRSFPHPEYQGYDLGEIYLNQTLLDRKPDQLALLLTHGLLHLLGYDHERKSDMLKMKRLEKEILGKASSQI